MDWKTRLVRNYFGDFILNIVDRHEGEDNIDEIIEDRIIDEFLNSTRFDVISSVDVQGFTEDLIYTIFDDIDWNGLIEDLTK